jgi:multidrug efflux system outer membrane protein
MRNLYLILLSGVLIYFSGCAVGPDFEHPEYAGTNEFRFDTVNTAEDTIVNLKWWELFNDPVLDTLIAHALIENRDVMIAAARIESARANLGMTKAEQWPTLGYSANVAGGNYGGGILFNNTTSSFNAYPEMYWEIGFWGKYRRMNESARAELLASEYGMRTVQIGLISAVASTYFALLEYQEKLRIARATYISRDSGLRIIKARFDYGIVAEIDYNQAQIQTAISASAIPSYERAVANTENALSVLLGKDPGSIVTGVSLINQDIPPEIPSGLPSQLLQRRPDVLQAEAMYAAQNARIGVAQALRWPSLNITGLLGYATNDLMAFNTGGLAWAVAGSLTGPIFQFGKNKRRVDVERANTEAALLQYENVTLQAFKEVEDALMAIKTYNEELKAAKIRNDAAINAEMLSGQRYDKGQTSYLEVLESQRQSFDAQLAYAQTQSALLESYIALYKALGGGWLSPEEEQQAKDEQAAEEQKK